MSEQNYFQDADDSVQMSQLGLAAAMQFVVTHFKHEPDRALSEQEKELFSAITVANNTLQYLRKTLEPLI